MRQVSQPQRKRAAREGAALAGRARTANPGLEHESGLIRAHAALHTGRCRLPLLCDHV